MARRTETIFEVINDDLVEASFNDEVQARLWARKLYTGENEIEVVRVTRTWLATMRAKQSS